MSSRKAVPVRLATTGRADSRVHIVRPGFTVIAECGVSVDGDTTREGPLREATCPKCRNIHRSR